MGKMQTEESCSHLERSAEDKRLETHHAREIAKKKDDGRMPGKRMADSDGDNDRSKERKGGY